LYNTLTSSKNIILSRIGGGSYWAANVSGLPTFGDLIRPKKYLICVLNFSGTVLVNLCRFILC